MKGRTGFNRIVSTPPAPEFWSTTAGVRTFSIRPDKIPAPFPNDPLSLRRRVPAEGGRSAMDAGTALIIEISQQNTDRNEREVRMARVTAAPQADPGLAVSPAMPIFQFNSGR